jgi:hypothetical protein
MEKGKETERYTFNSEELQRFENYLKEQTAHEDIIGLLDRYSGSFADWSVIISDAVNELIAGKQQLNMDCEKEREMLKNLSFMFTKLAYFSGMLSDWHVQLTFSKERTIEMIKDGHP